MKYYCRFCGHKTNQKTWHRCPACGSSPQPLEWK